MSSVSRNHPSLATAVVAALLISTVLGLSLTGLTGPASALAPKGVHLPQEANTTTTIETDEKAVSDNTEYNWSYNFSSAPALAVGSYLNLTGGELLTLGLVGTTPEITYIAFGVEMVGTGTSVTVTPSIALQNNTQVAGTTVLPASGLVGLKMVNVHGWWWTFTTTVGGVAKPIVGAKGWENGTYDLNTSTATGYESAFGYTVTPTFLIQESGASVPFSSLPALTIPTVFWFTVAASPVAPTTGQISSLVTAGTIGVSGQVQDSSLPWDTLDVPGTAPVTAAGTQLWGTAPPPGNPFPKVGATTNDTEFSGNVTTGIELTETVPTVAIASGQDAIVNVTLPINGTVDLSVGIAMLNIFGATYTAVEFGEWDAGALTACGDESPSQLLTQGDTYTVALTHTTGDSWNVTLDGKGVSGTAITGSGSCSGTYTLGAGVAWGVNDRPVFANGPYSTEPLLSFSGNSTAYISNTTWQMQANGGSWVAPGYGFAWQYKPAVDVALGDKQVSTLTMGVVQVTGTPPIAYSSPLANGTVLWTPVPVVMLHASPITVGSQGTVDLTAFVNLTGSPYSHATFTTTATLSSGTFTTPTAVAAGIYTFSWTAPAVTTSTPADLTLKATLQSGTGTGSATVAVVVVPPFTFSLQTYVNGTSRIGVTAGATVDLKVYANSTEGGSTEVPVTGVVLTPATNLTGSLTGTFSSQTNVSAGVYSFTYVTPLFTTSNAVSIWFQASEAGFTSASTQSSSLEVEVTPKPLPQLILSQVDLGTTTSYPSNTAVSFTVTVTSGGSDISGATVVFALSPAVPGVTLTATTTSSGVATLAFTTPAVSSSVTYDLSVNATDSGYAAASPVTADFTVTPSSSSSHGNSNSTGLSSVELYAIIGVVVVLVIVVLAVVMMRKKKTPPAGDGQAPPEYAQGYEPGYGQAPPPQ